MTIRDTIHQNIEISDQKVIDLIRTSEFQRLKRIKQLGLSHFIFPTAEHSRYVHSIGVYHLSTIFIKELEYKTNVFFNQLEKKAFQIACLLHDLGHGPFSHAAEDFFKYNHEDYTIKIIKDKNSQINQVLDDQDLIDQVILFIEKKHHNKILVSLLSSTIDIDRIDYLNRDCYQTGVDYGKIDLLRILSIIDIHDNKIVFLEKGIHTLEDFLLSRYHMFSQVYLNKKSLGYEALVQTILLHIKYLIDNSYKFSTNIDVLLPFYKANINCKDFLKLEDYSLYNLFLLLFENESNSKLINLLDAFLNYKELEINNQKDDYFYKTEKNSKAVYNKNEPIWIKTKTGEIKKLEELSKIALFLQTELSIENDEMTFSIKKSNHV